MHSEKWDDRFLELSGLIGSWSKDPSTKVGAVIVRPSVVFGPEDNFFNKFGQMAAMSPVIAYTEAAGVPNAAFAEWGARMKGYKVLMPRPDGPRKRGLIGPVGQGLQRVSHPMPLRIASRSCENLLPMLARCVSCR